MRVELLGGADYVRGREKKTERHLTFKFPLIPVTKKEKHSITQTK